jgi:flagellar basal body rod protein FlgC
MGGAVRRHEREFLAFHWEATATEAAGTGRMAHATRVAVIDAAIKNYNCLTATEKTTYNTQYQQLVTLRQTEQAASGNPATPAPTQCGG